MTRLIISTLLTIQTLMFSQRAATGAAHSLRSSLSHLETVIDVIYECEERALAKDCHKFVEPCIKDSQQAGALLADSCFDIFIPENSATLKDKSENVAENHLRVVSLTEMVIAEQSETFVELELSREVAKNEQFQISLSSANSTVISSTFCQSKLEIHLQILRCRIGQPLKEGFYNVGFSGNNQQLLPQIKAIVGPQIEKIEPNQIYKGQDQKLKIWGSSFNPTVKAYLNQSVNLQVEYVNKSLIQVVMTAQMQLSFKKNQADLVLKISEVPSFSSNFAKITLIEPFIIENKPLKGYQIVIKGQNQTRFVEIKGSNFSPNTDYICNFNSELHTKAKYISQNIIQCPLEPHIINQIDIGKVKISIQLAGNDTKFSINNNLYIADAPYLTQISPQKVFLKANNIIKIHGSWQQMAQNGILDHIWVKVEGLETIMRAEIHNETGIASLTLPQISKTGIFPLQISIDNQISFTQITSQDRTMASKFALFVLQNPILLKVTPTLLSREVIEQKPQIYEFTITGDYFQALIQDPVCKLSTQSPHDQEIVVNLKIVDKNILLCQILLQEGLVKEQMSLSVKLDQQESYEPLEQQIKTTYFPKFRVQSQRKDSVTKLPANIESQIILEPLQRLTQDQIEIFEHEDFGFYLKDNKLEHSLDIIDDKKSQKQQITIFIKSPSLDSEINQIFSGTKLHKAPVNDSNIQFSEYLLVETSKVLLFSTKDPIVSIRGSGFKNLNLENYLFCDNKTNDRPLILSNSLLQCKIKDQNQTKMSLGYGNREFVIQLVKLENMRIEQVQLINEDIIIEKLYINDLDFKETVAKFQIDDLQCVINLDKNTQIILEGKLQKQEEKPYISCKISQQQIEQVLNTCQRDTNIGLILNHQQSKPAFTTLKFPPKQLSISSIESSKMTLRPIKNQSYLLGATLYYEGCLSQIQQISCHFIGSDLKFQALQPFEDPEQDAEPIHNKLHIQCPIVGEQISADAQYSLQLSVNDSIFSPILNQHVTIDRSLQIVSHKPKYFLSNLLVNKQPKVEFTLTRSLKADEKVMCRFNGQYVSDSEGEKIKRSCRIDQFLIENEQEHFQLEFLVGNEQNTIHFKNQENSQMTKIGVINANLVDLSVQKSDFIINPESSQILHFTELQNLTLANIFSHCIFKVLGSTYESEFIQNSCSIPPRIAEISSISPISYVNVSLKVDNSDQFLTLDQPIRLIRPKMSLQHFLLTTEILLVWPLKVQFDDLEALLTNLACEIETQPNKIIQLNASVVDDHIECEQVSKLRGIDATNLQISFSLGQNSLQFRSNKLKMGKNLPNYEIRYSGIDSSKSYLGFEITKKSAVNLLYCQFNDNYVWSMLSRIEQDSPIFACLLPAEISSNIVDIWDHSLGTKLKSFEFDPLKDSTVILGKKEEVIENEQQTTQAKIEGIYPSVVRVSRNKELSKNAISFVIFGDNLNMNDYNVQLKCNGVIIENPIISPQEISIQVNFSDLALGWNTIEFDGKQTQFEVRESALFKPIESSQPIFRNLVQQIVPVTFYDLQNRQIDNDYRQGISSLSCIVNNQITVSPFIGEESVICPVPILDDTWSDLKVLLVDQHKTSLAQYSTKIVNLNSLEISTSTRIQFCSNDPNMKQRIRIDLKPQEMLSYLKGVILDADQSDWQSQQPLSIENSGTSEIEVYLPCWKLFKKDLQITTVLLSFYGEDFKGQIHQSNAQIPILILKNSLKMALIENRGYLIPLDQKSFAILYHAVIHQSPIMCSQTPQKLENDRNVIKQITTDQGTVAYECSDLQDFTGYFWSAGIQIGQLVPEDEIQVQENGRLEKIQHQIRFGLDQNLIPQGIIVGIDNKLEINIYTLEKELDTKEYMEQLDELTETRSQFINNGAIMFEMPVHTTDAGFQIDMNGSNIHNLDLEKTERYSISLIFTSKAAKTVRVTVETQLELSIHPKPSLENQSLQGRNHAIFLENTTSDQSFTLAVKLESFKEILRRNIQVKCLLELQNYKPSQRNTFAIKAILSETELICTDPQKYQLVAGNYKVRIKIGQNFITTDSESLKVLNPVQISRIEPQMLFLKVQDGKQSNEDKQSISLFGQFKSLQEYSSLIDNQGDSFVIKLISEDGVTQIKSWSISQINFRFGKGVQEDEIVIEAFDQKAILSPGSSYNFQISTDKTGSVLVKSPEISVKNMLTIYSHYPSSVSTSLPFEFTFTLSNDPLSINSELDLQNLTCVTQGSSSLQTYQAKSVLKILDPEFIQIVCLIEPPHDTIHLAFQIDDRQIISVSHEVFIEYVQDFEILSSKPQSVIGNKPTKVVFKGTNFGFALKYQLLCVVEQDGGFMQTQAIFDAQILDNETIDCDVTIKAANLEENFIIYLRSTSKDFLLDKSRSFALKVFQMAKITQIYPKIIHEKQHTVKVSLDRVVYENLDEILCLFERSDSQRLQVSADFLDQNTIFCSLQESSQEPFLRSDLSYNLAISLNKGSNMINASETIFYLPSFEISVEKEPENDSFGNVELLINVSQYEFFYEKLITPNCILENANQTEISHQSSWVEVKDKQTFLKFKLKCLFDSHQITQIAMKESITSLQVYDEISDTLSQNSLKIDISKWNEPNFQVKQIWPKVLALPSSIDRWEPTIELDLFDYRSMQTFQTIQILTSVGPVDCLLQAIEPKYSCQLHNLIPHKTTLLRKGLQILIGKKVDFIIKIYEEPRIFQTQFLDQNDEYTSIQGDNFSRKAQLFVGQDTRETLYVNDKELWGRGTPDEPWQISINQGFQKTLPYRLDKKEIVLRSIHPHIVPLYGINQQELTIEGDFQQVENLQALCSFENLNSTVAVQVDSQSIKCPIPATIYPQNVKWSLLPLQKDLQIVMKANEESAFEMIFIDPFVGHFYFESNLISLNKKSEESILIRGGGFSSKLSYKVCFQIQESVNFRSKDFCVKPVFKSQFSLIVPQQNLQQQNADFLTENSSLMWTTKQFNLKVFWNDREQMSKEFYQDIFFTNKLIKSLFEIQSVELLSYDQNTSKNFVRINLTQPQLVQFAESIVCKEPLIEQNSLLVHNNAITCEIITTDAILKIKAFGREFLENFSIFSASDHLISVEKFSPVQIPFGHQNFKLSITGQNLDLKPLLCLFEYEGIEQAENLKNLVSKIDSDHKCLVRYLPTSIQDLNAKVKIVDGSGRSKVYFEDQISVSPIHNIILSSVVPTQFYTPASLTVSGNSFDSSCYCTEETKQIELVSEFVEKNTLICSVTEMVAKESIFYQKYPEFASQKPIAISLNVFCDKRNFSADNPQTITIMPMFQIKTGQIQIIESEQQILLKAHEITVPVSGKNLHSNLYCVLKFTNSDKIYEMLVDQVLSHKKVLCKFDFENEFPKNTQLWLKDYNSENPDQITESNKVDVFFIPRIQIWQSDPIASYFVRNIDQEIVLESNFDNLQHNFDQIWCEFKHEGTIRNTDLKISGTELICKEPFISHQLSGQSIQLTIVAQYSSDLSRSNKLDIQLKSLPTVKEVSPLYTPVGVKGTVHTIRGSHFSQETTFLVFNRTIEIPLVVISDQQATFEAPLSNKEGLMSLQVATRHSQSISDSQISLLYIELPQITRLVPAIIPQVSTSLVIIEGRNFTEYTQCVIMNKPQPTTFMTSFLLQCEVDPQQFAPLAFSDNRLSVRLLEYGLYLNLQTEFSLLLTNMPYVSKVEPRRVFAEMSTNSQTVKVFVSNIIPKHGDSNLPPEKAMSDLLFCKIHEKIVVKVSKIVRDSGCSEQDQQIYDSGTSEHLNKVVDECRTDQLIYECKVPFLPNKLAGSHFHVQILTGRDSEFTKANLDESEARLSILARPELTSILNHKLPYPADFTEQITLVDSLENGVLINLTGLNFQSATFDPNDQLVCVLNGAKFKQKAIMTVLSATQGTCKLDPKVVKCNKLPCFVKLSLAMDIQGTELKQGKVNAVTKTQSLRGSVKLLLYKVPQVYKLTPNLTLKGGGQQVMIHGEGLIHGFGDIICAFGSHKIPAKIHIINSLVECESPIVSESGLLDFSISIDGGNHFIKSNSASQFGIIEPTVQVTDIQPQQQTFWGDTDIQITAENLPFQILQTLSLTSEPSILCKFDFSDVSDTVMYSFGIIKSAQVLTCPLDRHLKASSSIKLSVSFNKHEWILVSNSITITQDVQTRPQIQEFDLLDQISSSYQPYATLLQLQGIPDSCPVKSEFKGSQIHLKTPIVWNTPILLNVRIEDQLSMLPDLTKAQFFDSVEFTETINVAQKAMTVLKYNIDNQIFVEYAYESVPLQKQMVNLQLYGLYVWLRQNIDSIVACEGQHQEFTAQIRTFQDSTVGTGDSQMRMTCKIGYNLLQSPFERSNEILNVDCVNPYHQIDNDQLLPDEVLEMTNITPHVAFVFDENIRVKIEATPLYKANSVACKFQDVIIEGTYTNDETGASIICVIPSLQYLVEQTKTGLENDLNLPVQISQNGIDFSNNSFTFKFLQTSQQTAIDYSIGPDTGSTIIQIRVDDFVEINGADLPSFCVFPGHEQDPASNYGVISASHIGPNLIQCVTPPLIIDQKAIKNGLIFDTELITTVKVHVDLLERRSLTHFWFSYIKDARVTHFDPPNMYFGSSVIPRTLKVFGQHFIPVTEEALCRVIFDEELNLETQIPARYINNRTMECDIPAPPAQKQLPFSAKIEVSFNQGQQFTTQQSLFWYSSRDMIISVFPSLNFVHGNTILNVKTSYFFDKSSVDAQCKFVYTDPDTAQIYVHTTNLVSFDSQGVLCLQPPANLISDKLNAQGGPTQLSVSSNGIDFSNEILFTYLPAVQFTKVFPTFVQMDKQMVVKISGSGFAEASVIDLMRVRLTRILALKQQTPQVFVVQQVQFDGIDSLSFTWPNAVFLDKDQVSLEVTFDEQFWFKVSTELVTVYRTIILTRPWPTHVYTNEIETEIYLQAGETNSATRGGDIWDMTLFDNLKCKFQSQNEGVQFTNARFFNSTHAGCLMPTYTQAEDVQVAITIDGGNTFSENTIPVSVVQPPIILALNNTEYFYTLDEQVYVEVRGYNFKTSKHTYVRIGDQVQLIETVAIDSTKDPPENTMIFKMPLQLDLGPYEITVSTDGMNYRPDVTSATKFFVTITKCPNGYTCEQEVATICPDAHFCQFDNYQVFEPLVCPLGTYMTTEGAGVCTPCDVGKYCPDVALFVPQQCPLGFLCQAEGQKSLTDLKECPAGYTCPSGTVDLNPKQLKTINNMKKCPDGFYCPKGMQQQGHIYGNFTTPQVCKDGTLCAQTKHHEDVVDKPGAVTQYGNLECQPGTYCQKGMTKECPKGHHCPRYDLDEPHPCTSGYYMEGKNATKCDICPFGTYCTQSRMEIPVKCIPGWTCQHEGGSYPQQLCPGGNFCHQSTVTNMTNSTLRDFYKPNLCFEGTYCLDGAFTPIIDQENEQAAQACIAGTFCSEGSDSPDGKGKCKEGFYCPEGSNEMIPAQPGSAALGTGNTSPSLCAPGSYQDEIAQASCKQCPRGFYCPEQAMIEPIICDIGTFSKAESSTQCTNCPLGTYSDLQGVKTEEDCKVCESRFRCTQTGLTKMQMAVECQEGYECGYGTTNTVMLNSKVQSGYFGDYNITGMPEYKMCLPGKYCPSATAASKVKQLDCLRGYFCPFGTAASLSIKGDFNTDIRQLNKWELVKRIDDFIKETELMMEKFEEDFSNVGSIDQLVEDLLKAGNEQAAFNIQWEQYKYALNQTIIAERRKYLEEELIPDVRCPEDALLPDDLIESYTKNGTNLRCPKGTQSERASWCLGQCVINLANKQSVSVLNPVTDVIRISSLTKQELSLQAAELGSLAEKLERENRKLQAKVRRNLALNTAKRDFDIVGPGVFDKLHRQVVKPLEIVRISFNFTDLPEKLLYNDHFSITILNENGKEYRLPHYFSQDNNRVTEKRELLQIRIFNWTPSDKEFQIGLDLFHGLFIPKLKDLSDKVIIEAFQAERQTRFTNYTHGVIIGEVLLDGKTLPYNTPDYGNDPDLWLDFVSTSEGVNPTTKGLDKDQFDSTYWQSKQINSVIMPWLPYFSNCNGFDSRIIFYDLFEYSKDCNLQSYDTIRIVSPIPTYGLEPQADKCEFAIKCRFDEDLTFKRSQTTRWYNLSEETIMFYLTKDPIPIENFHKLEDSAVVQTFYNSLVEDGSDDLIPVPFIPTELSGIPRLVEIDFLYFQKDLDTKVVQSMSITMRNYTEDEFGPDGNVDPNYTLKINYKALDYFNLTNTFQFDIPIYILLFNLVSILMILSMLCVWLLQLMCSRAKVPPKIRFKHLFNVTFQAPASGVLLSCIPALLVGIATVTYRESTLFETVAASWTDLGSELSNKVIVQQKRGRVGLIFCVSGFLFLLYGAAGIIHVPSEEDEVKILNKQKMAHQRERLELSQDSEDDLKENPQFEKEEKIRVRFGLQNKQKHFFVMCIFTTIFLMIKLEFSYTKIFSANIKTFLLLFMFGDIVIEQLLVRLIMAEALLVSPILGTFVVTEFIMTMGAEDLQSFIFSYFIESMIVVISRIFVGPWVEKLEAFTQITIIKLSQRITWVRNLFKQILVKQLATQMQLMSLTEYNQRRKTAVDQEETQKKRHFYDWQREKGEGLEGLLGSVNTYSSQTQALFLIPFVLLFIMYFANETKIPQNYKIRKTDLQYYFTFTAVIILPQLIIDVFILHVLEIRQGYKIYDYFTYCNYRFITRQARWIQAQNKLDHSIIHTYRSLDAFCFSSQYYYLISLSTWGILFLYLGAMAVIRNLYNPFADPILIFFACAVVGIAQPVKWILNFTAYKIGLWKITSFGKIRFEGAQITQLDEKHNMKKLVKNMQTNPFRSKFLVVNREWIISNIALILGGRQFQEGEGAEFNYIKNVYQTVVDLKAEQEALKEEQDALKGHLKMMPYNQQRNNEQVDVSSDCFSDLPETEWDVPESLAKVYVFRLAKMWLDWARQNMRLKIMIADIVHRNLKGHCQNCGEKFRLQVIQKIDFNALTDKFRQENVGVPFTVDRWRRFYKRRQIFTTLCMECAYIDNLYLGQMKARNPELHQLMTENALKHIGAAEVLVAKKLKRKHVRNIALYWVWQARSSILHKYLEAQAKKAEAQVVVDKTQIDTDEQRKKILAQEQNDKSIDEIIVLTNSSQKEESSQTFVNF